MHAFQHMRFVVSLEYLFASFNMREIEISHQISCKESVSYLKRRFKWQILKQINIYYQTESVHESTSFIFSLVFIRIFQKSVFLVINRTRHASEETGFLSLFYVFSNSHALYCYQIKKYENRDVSSPFGS